MTIYIVLFRGINVGGNKKVKMETLRNMLVGAGFEGVATCVQSGNVVLKSSKTARQIAEVISKGFSGSFGFESRIFIRSTDEWNCMINKNPYSQAVENPISLHSVILEDDPTDAALEAFAKKASETESFAIGNRVLYLYTPDGFGTSPLAAALDKALKVPLTSRNWRTVLALQKLAEAA